MQARNLRRTPIHGALDFLAKVAALSRRRNGFETRMRYQKYLADVGTVVGAEICWQCGNYLMAVWSRRLIQHCVSPNAREDSEGRYKFKENAYGLQKRPTLGGTFIGLVG